MNGSKIKNFINKNIKWIIMLAFIIIFCFFAEKVFVKETIKLDVIVYNFIAKYIICDFLTPFMKFITWFGSARCLIIISMIVFIVIKNKKIGLAISLNLFNITILNQILKFLLQRPRPTGFRIIEESGYSFPSGHSMVSMAFYGFLIYLIYKYF